MADSLSTRKNVTHTLVDGKTHSYKGWYLGALSTALLSRYKGFKRLSDLEDGINAAQQALMLEDETSSDWIVSQNNFCMALFARFELTNQKIDVDSAESGLRKALVVAQEYSPIMVATVEENLGSVLMGRFRRFSAVSDINEAIALLQKASSVTLAGVHALVGRKNNLGIAFYERYHALGQIADLESALDLFEEAVNASYNDPILHQISQGHLAMALRTRFEILHRKSDLDSAIQLYGEVLTKSLNKGIDSGLWHNNLGNALRARFEAYERLGDLELALDHLRQAIQLARPGSTDSGRWHANLGKALSRRYELLGQVEDLQTAIQSFQTAISATNEGSADWAEDRANLGGCHLRRFIELGQEHDKDEAIKAYEDALSVYMPELWPVNVLEILPNVVRLYVSQASWAQAAELMLLGVRAVNTLYRVQLLEMSREVWLSRAMDLFSNTAYLLARANRLREATIVLEQGRAHSLNTALAGDRVNMQSLQRDDPELFDLYKHASTQLRMLELRAREGRQNQDDISTTKEIRDNARIAWNELNYAIARIRHISGFEGFLMEATFEDISLAVQPGFPLVYLITTDLGSLILILSRQNTATDIVINEIWLDDFTNTTLKAGLVQVEGQHVIGGYLPAQLIAPEWLQPALENLLPLLGENLVAPLAAEARNLEVKGLILIPSGLLNLVPLHGASYDRNGKKIHLLDEFTIAYVPSGRVMISARKVLTENAQQTPTLLGIGNPLPSHQPLPFARAEIESAAALFAPNARFLFFEQEATKKAFHSQFVNATHIHLSCHGMFSPDEPLKSHLQLAQDDILTLEDILNEERLPKNCLVVLSACQTAITEYVRLPDEAIGLPSGFLQAGAPGVIGTLWSVNDLSTALLMAKFYELYLPGDFMPQEEAISAPSALRSAQTWLRDLTNSDLLAYLQGSAAHLSPVLLSEVLPRARQAVRNGRGAASPYADPYHWAAFIYHGAM